MDIDKIPRWILELETEDANFMKNFVLKSGSLKEIAKMYDVSYPTVRLRLDKLIEKIKMNENTAEDSYVSLIKKLALSEKIDFEAAKILINEYRKLKEDDINGEQ